MNSETNSFVIARLEGDESSYMGKLVLSELKHHLGTERRAPIPAVRPMLLQAINLNAFYTNPASSARMKRQGNAEEFLLAYFTGYVVLSHHLSARRVAYDVCFISSQSHQNLSVLRHQFL
jgi:hypothetical protein